MNRSKSPIYILSFLIIFLSLTFTSHNVSSSQIHCIPQSKGEEELAKLFYTQILEDHLDEFVETLNNYPQYINIVYCYSEYKDFFTPLQLAVIFARDRFIDELLKREVDPFLPTLSKGDTVLHLSPMPHITKRFIDLGLDLEALNHQNMTPLLVQVFKKRLNRDVILTLLKAGANVEARTGISGLTALHVLFKPYHLRSDQEDLLMILKDILDHDGRVDARSKRGETPLHFAVNNNNIQAIQILVDKAEQVGIEDFVNIKDFQYGNTPLFSAYLYQAKAAISYLLKLKADPFLENKSKISVNKSARRESRRGSNFARFVLDEIRKYSELPDRCVQSLTKEGGDPLYESK